VVATRKYNAIGSARLGALNWEEAGQALASLPVVIPLGGAAIEHGPHLPYDTDAIIATALVDAVAERFPILVAPPIDYVYAPELDGRGGTMSLSADGFIGLVSDVVRSLARHGARHIVFVARGLSTLAPLQIVSRESHESLGVTVAIASEAGLAHDARAALLVDPTGYHAGEAETSLMLAIDPDRVRPDRAVSGSAGSPLSRTGLHEPVVIIPSHIDNETGVDGDPAAATADVGRQIFEATVAEIVAHLESATRGWDAPPVPKREATVSFQTVTPVVETGVRLRNCYADDASAALTGHAVAVLPMGAASKEHGYHLPNQTDLLTAEALGNAAVAQLPVLLLPAFGYGYYPAFVDWPGSMSLSPAVYRRVVNDIIACLVRAGVRKVFLLDTGLSTRPVLEIAARDALREHGITVALATTELGRDAALELFDGEGTHANEDETALMLAIAPDQVDLARAVPDLRPSTVLERRDPFAPPAVIQGGKMRSASGVFGDPTKATAESGRAYLDAKVSDLNKFLREFIELQTRDVRDAQVD